MSCWAEKMKGTTDLGSLRQQHHRAGDLAGVAVDEPPLGAAHIFLQRNRRKRGGFRGEGQGFGKFWGSKSRYLPAIDSGKTFKSLQIMKC